MKPYQWPGKILGSIVCSLVFAIAGFLLGLFEGALYPWYDE